MKRDSFHVASDIGERKSMALRAMHALDECDSASSFQIPWQYFLESRHSANLLSFRLVYGKWSSAHLDDYASNYLGKMQYIP